jgi:hypothetical protein
MIVITAMRLEKLRQVDLNLVITFAAVAEEKHYGGSIPATAEPACCKPGAAAGPRYVSG